MHRVTYGLGTPLPHRLYYYSCTARHYSCTARRTTAAHAIPDIPPVANPISQAHQTTHTMVPHAQSLTQPPAPSLACLAALASRVECTMVACTPSPGKGQEAKRRPSEARVLGVRLRSRVRVPPPSPNGVNLRLDGDGVSIECTWYHAAPPTRSNSVALQPETTCSDSASVSPPPMAIELRRAQRTRRTQCTEASSRIPSQPWEGAGARATTRER